MTPEELWGRATNERRAAATCATAQDARALQLALYRVRRNAQSALDRGCREALERGEAAAPLHTSWEGFTVRRRGREVTILPTTDAYNIEEPAKEQP